MNKKKYIGIDIGGTAVKIGSVDEDGTIHATETYAVNFDGYETPILQTVVKSCHNFLEKYRENASEYAGIGVSATGAISTKKGVVEGTAGHIKNWINSPIRQVMEQEFHQKCLMMRMQRLLGKRGLVLQRAKKMLSLSRLEQV